MRQMVFFLIGMLIISLTGTVSARETIPLMEENPDWVLVKAEAGKIRQMTGVVQGVDLAAGSLNLKNRRGEKRFKIVKETQFKKGRKKLNIGDLRPGNRVVVKYRDLGDVNQAHIIKLEQK